MPKLRKVARPNIRLLGWQPSEIIRDYYSRCKAVVMPGAEDFGIVPVEAMACGKPVIAYGYGGAMETVVDGLSGVIFPDQTVQSLNLAVERFETISDQFDPAAIRLHSEAFSTQSFKSQIQEHIAQVVSR